MIASLSPIAWRLIFFPFFILFFFLVNNCHTMSSCEPTLRARCLKCLEPRRTYLSWAARSTRFELCLYALIGHCTLQYSRSLTSDTYGLRCISVENVRWTCCTRVTCCTHDCRHSLGAFPSYGIIFAPATTIAFCESVGIRMCIRMMRRWFLICTGMFRFHLWTHRMLKLPEQLYYLRRFLHIRYFDDKHTIIICNEFHRSWTCPSLPASSNENE